MTRALTQAQIKRRSAVLGMLREDSKTWSAADLRQALARRYEIFITIDTVQDDLRAMEKAGSVSRQRFGGREHRWEVRR